MLCIFLLMCSRAYKSILFTLHTGKITDNWICTKHSSCWFPEYMKNNVKMKFKSYSNVSSQYIVYSSTTDILFNIQGLRYWVWIFFFRLAYYGDIGTDPEWIWNTWYKKLKTNFKSQGIWNILEISVTGMVWERGKKDWIYDDTTFFYN